MAFRLTVLVWLLLGSALAVAQPTANDKAARALYEEGETLFAVGKFLDAAQKFEQAYAMSKRPKLLWNLAQAYRRQAEVDGDAAHVRRALAVIANLQPQSDEERADLATLERSLRDALAEHERKQAQAASAPPTTNATPTTATPTAATTSSNPALVASPPERRSRRGLYIGIGVGVGAVVVLSLGLGLGLGLHGSTTNVWSNASASCTAPCQTVDFR